MRDQRFLTKIVHGSTLYGTNTPKSDMDYKSVFIPSAKDILLGNVNKVNDNNTKADKSMKNTSLDVDDSAFSVAKFLKLITDGDTTGVEILLTPSQFRLETSPEFEEILSYKDKLLNRKSRGFVGYCRTQAQKYSVKGSRLKAAKEAMQLFSLWQHMDKVGDIENQIEKFVADNEHCSIVTMTTPIGVKVKHLSVCDRMAPFTVKIDVARKLFTNVYENYGTRAKQAADNSNIDWKAVSHAVRVGEQAIELLQTGNLTFPRPNADYLRAVKLGEIEFSKVTSHLEQLLDTVEVVAENSILPETSDLTLVNDLIVKFHKNQIVHEKLLWEHVYTK